MSQSLLVVEDDGPLREAVATRFQKEGWEALKCGTLQEARRILTVSIIDVILLDLYLPDGQAFDLIPDLVANPVAPAFIIITGDRDTKVTVRAIKEGAFDYVVKPIDFEELALLTERARLLSQARRVHERETSSQRGLSSLWGSDPKMDALRAQIKRLAAASCETLLVIGETGTGKQLVAQAFHQESGRATRPFVQLNVAALPATLIESELFGFERGAFTDAKQPRRGLFEDADTGTLFLDEIGELDPSLQPKLLRVLEDRRIRRIGSSKEVPVNVRVVAATNRDLDEMVSAGRFRSDLLYRLDVARIEIPSLRERPRDIIPLACRFLAQLGARRFPGFTREAEAALLAHPWPGNVRELRNTIERAILNGGSGLIGLPDLQLRASRQGSRHPSDPAAASRQGVPKARLDGTSRGAILPLDAFEKDYVRQVLKLCDNNKSEAARKLGISRTTLREKLDESGAAAPDGQDLSG